MAEPPDDGAPAPARAVWSGMLTFGLVTIPVELLAANRGRRTSLRMLAPDGEPLRRRYVCPDDGEVLEPEDLIRGYEIEKGRFVLVTDEELDALAPAGSRDLTLERFVERADLDPLRFDRAYFLAPAGASSRAYHLLTETLEAAGRTGIARFVMRGKEYLAAVIARAGLLRAEILRFDDELRTWEDVGLPAPRAVPAAQVRRVEQEIDGLVATLDRGELADEEAARLEELAERKRRQGEDVVEVGGVVDDEGGELVDLMQVLKERMGLARAPRPEPAGGEELDGLSKHALYERARALDIPGRSRMTKEELADAVRHAGASGAREAG